MATNMEQELKKVNDENKKLRAALKPFAEFNDALQEWRYGPSYYLLQEKRQERTPYLRWTEPTPPPYIERADTVITIRVLEVWPSDFQRAEDLLSCDN